MAKVNFKRCADDTALNNIDVTDGNFIVTREGKAYIDYGNTRTGIGGTPDLEMSDTSTNSVQNKVVKEYIDNINDNVLSSIDEINNKRAGTVLYSNASGTTNEIILSETSANYRFLEVYGYETTTNSQLFTKYDVNSGHDLNLNTNTVIQNGNLMRFISTNYNVNGNTITPTDNAGIVHIFGMTINTQQKENTVLITKVVGYK